MSLRLRLIVAFFLFSVVPLAAVTFYSYTSNLRALQVAAQHETEMLTGELTQRMQVVTTQISERVEHLMDMPAAASTTAVAGTTGRSRSSAPAGSKPTVVARATPAPAAAPPAAPAAPSAPSAPATAVTMHAIDPTTMEGQVAGALGEVAMLLNNVEVRGVGRFGGAGPMSSARDHAEGNPSVAPGAAGRLAGVARTRTRTRRQRARRSPHAAPDRMPRARRRRRRGPRDSVRTPAGHPPARRRPARRSNRARIPRT